MTLPAKRSDVLYQVEVSSFPSNEHVGEWVSTADWERVTVRAALVSGSLGFTVSIEESADASNVLATHAADGFAHIVLGSNFFRLKIQTSASPTGTIQATVRGLRGDFA